MKSLVTCLIGIVLGVASLSVYAQYNNRDYRSYHHHGNEYRGYRHYGPLVWGHPHNRGWMCNWNGCWYQPYYNRY